MSRKPGEEISPIGLIDEAFHVMRQMPASAFLPYYLGTMPFLLALLYFWSDMTQNAFAREYCIRASLGLALLFMWMKLWQSVFSLNIHRHVSRVNILPVSFLQGARLFWFQAVLGASGIVILPVAMVVSLPFAWVYALYQLALVQDMTQPVQFRQAVKENLQIANRQTFLIHMIILIFSVFGLFIAVNIGVGLYILPVLAKKLFGIESSITMGGFNLMNTTYIFSTICITHLFVDPVIKIIFVLIKFYEKSRRTGEDIVADLAAGQSPLKKKGVALIFLLCLLTPDLSQALDSRSARETAVRPGALHFSMDEKDLEAAIEEVIKHREYAWRMPVDEIEDNREGFFYSSMKWLLSRLNIAKETVSSWVEAFFKWLSKLWPDAEKSPKAPDPESLVSPRTLTIMMLILVIFFLMLLTYSALKRKALETPASIDTPDAMPDISDENLLADRFACDKWVSLAMDLVEKGDLRLAVRALFLGTLAYLSDRQFIRIARHKSNREYRMELSRKARTDKRLQDDFNHTIRIVDRVWYGMHQVNQEMFEHFFTLQKRISGDAE